jgi:hypothetical protein
MVVEHTPKMANASTRSPKIQTNTHQMVVEKLVPVLGAWNLRDNGKNIASSQLRVTVKPADGMAAAWNQRKSRSPPSGSGAHEVAAGIDENNDVVPLFAVVARRCAAAVSSSGVADGRRGGGAPQPAGRGAPHAVSARRRRAARHAVPRWREAAWSEEEPGGVRLLRCRIRRPAARSP